MLNLDIIPGAESKPPMTSKWTEQHRKLTEHALAVIEGTAAAKWKQHGFGLLQVSMTPAHRLNIWADELRTIGRDDGAWHTHRARIHATVLAGSVYNTEIGLASERRARVDLWEVPHRGDGDMRRVQLDKDVGVGTPEKVTAGGSYTIELGRAHWTEPGPFGAVTSALMMDMVDTMATVMVEHGRTPSPAFEDRSEADLIDKFRHRAIMLLHEVLDA